MLSPSLSTMLVRHASVLASFTTRPASMTWLAGFLYAKALDFPRFAVWPKPLTYNPPSAGFLFSEIPMRLTPHFTLEEMTHSQTAARMGLSNEPSEREQQNLLTLCNTLEAVRALLGGKPITISSGFRSIAVNRAVGGSKTSAHCMGLAADFICPSYGNPLAICKRLADSDIQFDQIIEEGTWVHISIDPRHRRQVLTMRNGKYSMGLS